jgi:membrane fusion protein, epimerase transport system
MNVLDVPIHLASQGLVESHSRDMARLTKAAALVFALAIAPSAAWLTFAPLATAVVVPGVVTVDLNRRTVQHAEGGLVAEVRVRNGQQVRRGDPLVVLGDVAVSADIDRWNYRVRAEEMAIARLEAEQAGAASMTIPAGLMAVAREDPRLEELVGNERALFAAKREALVEQVVLLREQRDKITQELQSIETQIVEAKSSLAHQREELATNRALVSDGFVSPARVGQLQATVADYGVKLAERESERARAEQRRIDIDLRLRTIWNDHRQQASDQLKIATHRLAELREEWRKPADAAARQVIVAPVDGEVMDLKFHAPGGVIAPRETIAAIVPSAPKLLVEAQVRPEDIEQVRRGLPADIRFTAFNPRTTPSVEGHVTYVSADRLVDPQTRAAHYVAQVEIDTDAVARVGAPGLQAGMPAEVIIRGRERTPLEYLTQPVADVLRRGAREP